MATAKPSNPGYKNITDIHDAIRYVMATKEKVSEIKTNTENDRGEKLAALSSVKDAVNAKAASLYEIVDAWRSDYLRQIDDVSNEYSATVCDPIMKQFQKTDLNLTFLQSNLERFRDEKSCPIDDVATFTLEHVDFYVQDIFNKPLSLSGADVVFVESENIPEKASLFGKLNITKVNGAVCADSSSVVDIPECRVKPWSKIEFIPLHCLDVAAYIWGLTSFDDGGVLACSVDHTYICNDQLVELNEREPALCGVNGRDVMFAHDVNNHTIYRGRGREVRRYNRVNIGGNNRYTHTGTVNLQLPGNIYSIHCHGDKLYIGGNGYLHCYDVTPYDPESVANIFILQNCERYHVDNIIRSIAVNSRGYIFTGGYDGVICFLNKARIGQSITIPDGGDFYSLYIVDDSNILVFQSVIFTCNVYRVTLAADGSMSEPVLVKHFDYGVYSVCKLTRGVLCLYCKNGGGYKIRTFDVVTGD